MHTYIHTHSQARPHTHTRTLCMIASRLKRGLGAVWWRRCHARVQVYRCGSRRSLASLIALILPLLGTSFLSLSLSLSLLLMNLSRSCTQTRAYYHSHTHALSLALALFFFFLSLSHTREDCGICRSAESLICPIVQKVWYVRCGLCNFLIYLP